MSQQDNSNDKTIKPQEIVTKPQQKQENEVQKTSPQVNPTSPQQGSQEVQLPRMIVTKKKPRNLKQQALRMRIAKKKKKDSRDFQYKLKTQGLPVLVVALSVGVYYLSVKTNYLDGFTNTLKNMMKSAPQQPQMEQELQIQPIKIIEKIVETITVRDVESQPEPEQSQPVGNLGYSPPDLDFF